MLTPAARAMSVVVTFPKPFFRARISAASHTTETVSFARSCSGLVRVFVRRDRVATNGERKLDPTAPHGEQRARKITADKLNADAPTDSLPVEVRGVATLLGPRVRGSNPNGPRAYVNAH